MNTKADSAYLAFAIVGQIGMAAYVYWCVKRGFIWLRSERVEREKNPRKFTMVLRGYLAFEIFLALITLYMLFEPHLHGTH